MNLKSFLLCATVLVFISCKKNKDEFKYFGTASAMFNGRAWQASKVRCGINVPCYKGKLGITFYVYNRQGFLRESLIFEKIPIEKKSFLLFPRNPADMTCADTVATAGYFTSQDDGDVALDAYKAINSIDNYFTIEDYNERTKELRGSFSVTFEIFRRQDPNSADTIRVTNGKFYTRILD
ncbi:MAG: hypothetical protein ABR502_08750 [Chitinophagaceae bacterium]